jgi:hypothetical protein
MRGEQMSFFATLVRWYIAKHLTPAGTQPLDAAEYERLQRGVRRFHGYPPAPDFCQLAREIVDAPDRATGESLLLTLVAITQREICIERDVVYCLGLQVGKATQARRHHAHPGLSASATWWSGGRP